MFSFGPRCNQQPIAAAAAAAAARAQNIVFQSALKQTID